MMKIHKEIAPGSVARETLKRYIYPEGKVDLRFTRMNGFTRTEVKTSTGCLLHQRIGVWIDTETIMTLEKHQNRVLIGLGCYHKSKIAFLSKRSPWMHAKAALISSRIE